MSNYANLLLLIYFKISFLQSFFLFDVGRFPAKSPYISHFIYKISAIKLDLL